MELIGEIKYTNKRSKDHITGDRKSGVSTAGKGYPKSVIEIASDTGTQHPTQKPVALMEYLIKTYTNEGEIVLDNTFGSCTTGVACVNLGRKFIGIEMDEKYYSIGKERVLKAVLDRSKS